MPRKPRALEAALKDLRYGARQSGMFLTQEECAAVVAAIDAVSASRRRARRRSIQGQARARAAGKIPGRPLAARHSLEAARVLVVDEKCSLRQASRITGVSLATLSRYVNGTWKGLKGKKP
jgi:DNA invertase Pin-like site-specific DNA recombinase